MKTTINELPDNVQAKISMLAVIDEPAARLQQAIQIVDAALTELNDYLVNDTGTGLLSEIEIFRTIRPQIVSYRIEEDLRYRILVNKPIGTTDIHTRYLEDEIKAIQTYFRRYAFHYQYFRNGFRELDEHYFVRNSSAISSSFPLLADGPSALTTPMSQLFAKFLGYERVQYYLINEIATVNGNMKPVPGGTGRATGMSWTGDIINLIELAYGIWLTGQLNNGNAQLGEIIRWLEEMLQIRMIGVSGRFAEMGRRKTTSPTRYIDRMKDAILQKLEQESS